MRIKNLSKLTLLGAALAVSASSAFADTITLDSNSSTVTLTAVPTGSVIPLGAAFNLGPLGLAPWAGPIGTSTWVGPEAGTSVGGDVVAPPGTYTYTASFFDSTPTSSSGIIYVLADDTTSISLNGNLIVSDALANAGVNCTSSTPNCVTEASYALPIADFTSGTNTLTFDVNQDFGSATGLDFETVIATTPEPSSLLLLGTGLLGLAFVAFRKAKPVRPMMNLSL